MDVLIIGAGLSGVGAGAHLRRRCPDRTFAILEARQAIGGTWDLFRYPGVRSDSDMQTLGYSFRPWTDVRGIADGASIRRYIEQTAREEGVEPFIRFGHQVLEAEWSSEAALWRIQVRKASTGAVRIFTCNFLVSCAGYYSYAEGYDPGFAERESFQGPVIHPQFWPNGFDASDKRVVVIGSGATAVTLAPELAKTAKSVVMLQRSPTYVISRPAVDPLALQLPKWAPKAMRAKLVRLKNIWLSLGFYEVSRRWPDWARTRILSAVRRQLGDSYDLADFSPRYNPWDQRVCVVPDGDLFQAIRLGRVSVVTDTIARFTPQGVKLASGRELEADAIVTATGLKLNLIGDVTFKRDGRPLDMSSAMLYKGAMLSDVPNFMMMFGYTNASWTLKIDLVCDYLCRLLNEMRRRGATMVEPRRDPEVGEEPALGLTSGYVQRARNLLPRQGDRRPWKLRQSYPLDFATLRLEPLRDPALSFSSPRRPDAPKARTAVASLAR